MPTPAPTASWIGTSSSGRHPRGCSAVRNWIIVVVRMTAIGSFMHDSTSIVRPTRGLRDAPPPRSTAKTAAASVDDTTAPSNSAAGHGNPSTHADNATSPAVAATPKVASTEAGPMTCRIDENDVFSPPSNRISTSAIVPSRTATL